MQMTNFIIINLEGKCLRILSHLIRPKIVYLMVRFVNNGWLVGQLIGIKLRFILTHFFVLEWSWRRNILTENFKIILIHSQISSVSIIKQEVLRRTNRLLSLTRHGPNRKWNNSSLPRKRLYRVVT
jgi:hypothetical protein